MRGEMTQAPRVFASFSWLCQWAVVYDCNPKANLSAMNFLEQLNQQYGPQVSQQLSSRFGLDPSQTDGILGKVAPYVLGGLQSQAAHPQDMEGMQRVLETHGDESALDDIEGHFGRTESSGGPDLGGLLSGLLGGSQGQGSQQALANQLGISSGMLAKILPMLIPLILGAVTQKVRTGGQQSGAGNGGGGGMDVLGAILGQASGRSGGGGVLGDLAGAVLTGGQGGGMANKAGCLSSLLGGLLRRK